MTVSLALLDDRSVDATIEALRREGKRYERAFKGGMKAGGAFLARRIADGLPLDTGAMDDSIYVENGVGIAAPYAAIVEETHPTKAHHVKRRVVESQGEMQVVIAESTADLAARNAGPESVRHEFRDSPGYIPREEFKGRVKRSRHRDRARKKAGKR